MSNLLSRRDVTGAMAAGLIAQFLQTVPSRAAIEPGAARNADAFNARSPESVYRALGIATPQETPDIIINVPDVAENGANVPIEVTVKLPAATRVLVIGERNIFPLLADVALLPPASTTGGRAAPWLEVKGRLAETSHVRVIVEADGKLYTAARNVRVIVGGCLPG